MFKYEKKKIYILHVEYQVRSLKTSTKTEQCQPVVKSSKSMVKNSSRQSSLLFNLLLH